jgi:GTP-binding protein
LIKKTVLLKKFMRGFDLMFELGAEEQLDFPTVYGSAKNNWMSDHWENVTDNVEALDMVVANVPALKFLKELHKC